MQDKQNAVDQAKKQQLADNLKDDAVTEMNKRLQTVMASTQQSFLDLMSWTFSTGADWPTDSPPTPDYGAGEVYLGSQMFGKGAFLDPVSSQDIEDIKNNMISTMVSHYHLYLALFIR